jgi:hypothetical protein
MADANCKIHGTPFNGFGSYTFCNECDVENEAQSVYEEDKDIAIATATCSGVNAGVGTLAGLIDTGEFGWITFSSQQHIRQKGHVVLQAGTEVWLKQPQNTLGAVYRVKLSEIKTIPHMKHALRVLNNCPAYLEQILYNRSGRVTLGEVDVGAWDCPDP